MLWLQSKTKNNKIPVRARNVFLEYHCQYWKYILAGCNAIVVLRYKDHVWTWSRGHLCDHLTLLTSEPGSKERLSATKQSPLGAQESPDPRGSPEGNTYGPGTASSEPLLPSWSQQERRFPCVVWKAVELMLLKYGAGENSWDCKEIKPVNPKGNQSWIFIGMTDAEADISIWMQSSKEYWGEIRKTSSAINANRGKQQNGKDKV